MGDHQLPPVPRGGGIGRSSQQRHHRPAPTIRIEVVDGATADGMGGLWSDPIVCSFPRGLPASLESADGDDDDDDVPKFVLEKSPGGGPDNAADDCCRLIGKDRTCLYTAEYHHARTGTTNTNTTTSKLYVGVYDRYTRRWHIIIRPTAAAGHFHHHGHVFALAQTVPAYPVEHDNATTGALPSSLTTTAATAASSRQALFADFGSVKKRRVLASQAANRVHVDSVLGGHRPGMMQAIMRANETHNTNGVLLPPPLPPPMDETAATQQQYDHRARYLPPFDGHATDARHVYSAKTIAGPEVWGQVSRVVDACLRRHDADQHNSNDIVMALMHGRQHAMQPEDEPDAALSSTAGTDHRAWLPSLEQSLRRLDGDDTDGVAYRDRLRTTLVLHYFTKLLAVLVTKRFVPSPSTADRRHYFGVPPEVGQRFVDLFATKSVHPSTGQAGYAMSKPLRDKAVVHVLVLFVLADGTGSNMRTDHIKSLCDDLKMDVKEAAVLLRQAGFAVQRKAGTVKTTVVLNVPLAFPALLRGRGGGGGGSSSAAAALRGRWR